MLRQFSSNSKEFPKRLKDKIAVVTASTDGIGYAIAERLGLEGARVVVSSRKERNIQAAVERLKAQGVQVHGVKCHVGHARHRQSLFDETLKTFGGIDILVSNAAINPEAAPVLETSEFNWDRVFDVNVKASYLLAKEVRPYLKVRGGGNIVFVSSIAGYHPITEFGVYSVSKTTLIGLTKAASASLAAENVRVNCIAPGIVRTKFSTPLHENPAVREQVLCQIPLKRVAEPHEIAGTVAFLVSDDAAYITGETIVIAGGMASRL